MLHAIIRAALRQTITAKVSAQIAGGAAHETYTGAYSVEPDFDGETLGTKGKLMADDVTVQPITVARVSNEQGGRTIYIGGIING